MRVVMGQINAKVGDFAGNAAKIHALLAQWEDRADLILTPELSVTGYHPLDLLFDAGFLEAQEAALEEMRLATRGRRAALAVGCVTRNPGKGAPFFNALKIFADGALAFQYHKRLLPDYGVFDERRYFEPGREAGLWEWRGRRLGFLLCEDGWAAEEADPYPNDPAAELAGAGAEVLLSLNASPGTLGKAARREARFGRIAARHDLPLLYLNMVGGNDDLIFDGQSFVLDGRGAVASRLPAFEEAAAELIWEPEAGAIRAPGPVPPPLDDGGFLLGHLRLGLGDYLAKCGFDRVVVGVSGGIDSAVTLALARTLLAPDRIVGVAMPSPFSSEESLTLARRLCANLDVALHVHPIGAQLEAALAAFRAGFGAEPKRLTLENLQARIRGAVLMAYANQNGHLLLATGNKSELSVGYATLYGDMNGGLAPLGDLYKGEVTALGLALNRHFGAEAIPRGIIQRPPTAELYPGQRDSDALPDYPVLDAALRLHLEGENLCQQVKQACQETLAQAGFDRFDWLRRQVARAEFKRQQGAPLLRLHELAFGRGRRVPIAQGFTA